jgi:peroxiredoxin
MSTRTSRQTIGRGEVISDFTLNDATGNPVSSRAFYMRRNLVIAYLPAAHDERWRDWLIKFIGSTSQIAESDAQIFLITPVGEHLPKIQTRIAERSHITALLDPDRRAANRFGHDPDDGLLLITDRFGTVFHTAAGQPEIEELDPARIPEWIEFIACRCS